MTEQRPAPLVPAEVDLRDFPFMPLHVSRLRDSDLASDETPEACWAAVLLWCASWHQVPAGSIPAHDQWLAKQTGYVSRGRIADEWGTVRKGALRGWVECSDGRLYHPVVAEQAIAAWRGKLLQRWKTEAARVKKHNQRHKLDDDRAVQMPEFEEWIALGCPQGHALPVPGDKPPPSPGTPPVASPGTREPSPGDVPRETPSKRQREGQGQGQGLEEKRTRAPAGARSPGPDCPEGVDPQTWADWLALRKAKKAPVTATVLAGAVAEAAKAGMPLDAFLRTWCTRGTQALQADWLKPHERPAVNGHPAEPAWRTEQRERTAAFAGRYAEKRPTTTTTTIPQEGSDAPEVLG